MTTESRTVHQVPQVDPRTLRQVCGLFVTGVTVISTGVDGRAVGTTVNSFTSVSLDPPLVLFCLHRQSRLHGPLQESDSFAVNFLSARQEDLAWTFAGRDSDGFSRVAHHRVAEDVPVISDALAFLACRIVSRFPGGDHTIVLGEVMELGTPHKRHEPLIFFKGAMGALEEEPSGAHLILDG
ncbi:flavin reductase [Streptomyces sp. TRM43335]|uniref:Flavin reductase n=1 Tax=Streptomyces taklimakanensis TaxID=2569853 RepID=A0A6G2BFI0_9ACTN|nr:flavin reductase family protein [Streptomyces taklimakanensis]MTE21000.1 flavin reductase [Streptomyces taklimakanensis]